MPYEQQDDSDQDGASSSETGSSDTEGSTHSEETTLELKTRMESIAFAISCLFKLAVYIRNPNSRTRFSKALRYRPFDPDTKIDLLEQYEKFDIEHACNFLQNQRQEQKTRLDDGQPESKDRITIERVDSDGVLPLRLGRAITQRRQQFKYWRSHREKLSREGLHGSTTQDQAVRVQGTSGVVTTADTQELLQDAADTSGDTPGVLNGAGIGGETPNVDASAGQKESVIHTDTTATRFLPPAANTPEEDSVYAESVISCTTSIRGNDAVQFPPPPEGTEGSYFECPYCYTICPPKYRNTKVWR